MAQFASDSFTGVDGTTLQAHDANWVEHPSSAGGDMLITANRLQQRVSGEGFYYHSGSPSSANYSVSADLYIASDSPAFNATGVIGRTNTTANTFYHARYRIAGGWELYKRVNGTFALLGSSTVSTPSVEATVNLKLDMVGSAIRLLADGVELVSVADTSITAAGKSGLRISNNSAQTTSEGLHLDNFSADDAGGGTSAAGSSTGLATVSGVGASVAASTGSSSGLATVSGVSDFISDSGSTGSASGASTVSGVGASVAASKGSASGLATVSGVGAASTAGSSTGSASGSSTVNGVSASIAASVGSASGEAVVTGRTPIVAIAAEFSGGFPYIDHDERKKKQRAKLGIVKDLAPPPKANKVKALDGKKTALGPTPQERLLAQQEALNAELRRLVQIEAQLELEREEEAIVRMLMEL